MSYLQIYNEQVKDLLVSSNKVQVLECPHKGTVITRLAEVKITWEDEIMTLVRQAQENRVTGVTDQNQTSSRSHALLQLFVHSHQKWVSKITMIDLAGSERMPTKVSGPH